MIMECENCPCELYQHVLKRLSEDTDLFLSKEIRDDAHECCAIAVLLHLTTCRRPSAFLKKMREEFRKTYKDYPQGVEKKKEK